MALTFIYGNSGSGKSEYIYQRIVKEAKAHPAANYYVIVPEQFTMQTQKALVEHSPNGVIMNIDVSSFQRLAYHVFDELGVTASILEETGKSLILRRIAEKKIDEMTVLKGNVKKMGYVAELKSMISEFMQYGISPAELKQYMEQLPEGSGLRFKLQDIYVIYQAFVEDLSGKYVTAEQVLDVMIRVAEESELLRGSVFVFDGFTGFTPVQMKLLHKLMHLAKDIYVTVTMDVREAAAFESGAWKVGKKEYEQLFYMSAHMVQVLKRAASEEKLSLAEPIYIKPHEKSRLASNPILTHLEQNLFRVRSRAYEQSCEDVLTITTLQNPKAELMFAAAKIRQLMREKGYRFRDFALVCGKVELYEKYMESVFGMYEIPYFSDQKTSILYHPLIELIRAVMQMMEENYSYESVCRYLRTDLSGFTMEEVDLLDNYLLARGIRGASKWKNKFIRPFRRRHGQQSEDTDLQEELALLNQLRARLWEQTRDLYQVFHASQSSVKERVTALYQWMVKLSLERILEDRKEALEREEDEVLAAIYRQIYRYVIDLLDKMADLLGDEILSARDFADVLEAGFAVAKLGVLPPGNDHVILGDIERSRLDHVKVMFFLGVNDGLIPKTLDKGSILSQYDRELLESMHLELSPTPREQSFTQRFYLYLNLTKPSDALYVSYSRMSGDGKSIRPSYLVHVLQQLFSKVELKNIGSDTAFGVESTASAMDAYLTGLMQAQKGADVKPDEEWKALHQYLLHNKPWCQAADALFERAFAVFTGESLEADVAKLLYGTVLTSSVTRLESYAKCAFAHFLNYGLRLSERETSSFEALDLGTMFHAILQSYCIRLEESDTYDWSNVTEEASAGFLSAAMEEAILALPNDALMENARSAYMLERINRIMNRSIWALVKQIQSGLFRPYGYEVEFMQTDQLDRDGMMRTRGKIDRLDLYETEDQVFVKIIDYKSGNTKFQLLNLYHGMQLQLVVYLNAAMEKLRREKPDKEIVPAGIFYYKLDDPMVENLDGADEQEVLDAILKELQVKGLINEDPDVYTKMDTGLSQPSYTSQVLPIATKKDGGAKSNQALTSGADFSNMMEHATQMIRQGAQEILDGSIDVHPFKMGQDSGCKYCDYRSVCGFDQRLGYRYDEKEKLEDSDIKAKLAQIYGEEV